MKLSNPLHSFNKSCKMESKEYIVKETEIINIIDRFDIKRSKIAIVGGHYILLYEKKSDSLKPAIYQEFEEWGNMTFAKNISQNFPVKSFELAVKLFLHFRRKQIESKCVMLVNDDSLLRKEFRTQDHYELIKDRGKELRKRYFSSESNLPKSYKKILNTFNLSFKEFFAKFENTHFSEDSFLPRETIFVSERRLCKNFKKTVKAATSSDKLFKILKIEQAETDNINELTVETNKVDRVCLIKEGVCNCGGKTFQFYFELIKKGYNTIIFFIPDECQSQVKEGTDLICNSRELLKESFNIINITNIENRSDKLIRNNKLVINIYNNILNSES